MASVDIGLTELDTGADVFTFVDENYHADFTKRLVEMRTQKFLTDVTLQAGETVVPCHKLALSAASEYFRNLFQSEQVSSNIDLQDTSPACLTAVLDFIYTCQLKVKTQYIREVVSLSNQLQLKSLKAAADRYIAENINPSNCIGLFMLSKQHQLEVTLCKTRDVLLNEAEQILHLALDSEFKTLSEDELIDWISDDDLDVAEESVVFELVERWLNVDAGRDNETTVARALSHVRLPLCSPAYLIKKVQKSSFVRFPRCQQLLGEAKDYGFLVAAQESTDGMDNERTRPRHVSNWRLVVIGGAATGGANTQCWQLSMDGTQWQDLPSLPPGQENFPYFTQACVVGNDIVLTGGSHEYDAVRTTTSNAWLFSISMKKWCVLPSMKEARSLHAMAAVGLDVYVFAGYGNTQLSSVEKLDKSRLQWCDMAPMPYAGYPNFAVHMDGLIYVVTCGKECKVLQYNIKNNSWQVKASMGLSRNGCVITSLNKDIYVIGAIKDQCLQYCTSSDTWSRIISPVMLRPFGAAVAYRGKVVLAGGNINHSTGTYTDNIEEYHPNNKQWSAKTLSLPKPMYCLHILALK